MSNRSTQELIDDVADAMERNDDDLLDEALEGLRARIDQLQRRVHELEEELGIDDSDEDDEES
jgi:hypothetical protein